MAQKQQKGEPLVGYVLERNGQSRFVRTAAERVKLVHDGWTVQDTEGSKAFQEPVVETGTGTPTPRS